MATIEERMAKALSNKPAPRTAPKDRLEKAIANSEQPVEPEVTEVAVEVDDSAQAQAAEEPAEEENPLEKLKPSDS